MPDGLVRAALERHVVQQHHRRAPTLLEDGEDKLKEIELQCQCGSHLLVLAQKSSRWITSDSFARSSASFTMVIGVRQFVTPALRKA